LRGERSTGLRERSGWDATRSGGEPLDSDHLGVSVEALEIEGSGYLYQISCGRRGDHSGLPAVAVQSLKLPSDELGGDT
jgi:hypothetical protein